MMNLKSKFFMIFSIVMALACATPLTAQAEEDSDSKKVVAQTALEFATKKELNSFVPILNKEKLLCGQYACQLTEKCIKCISKLKGLGYVSDQAILGKTGSLEVRHYCIPKDQKASQYDYTATTFFGLAETQTRTCVDAEGMGGTDKTEYVFKSDKEDGYCGESEGKTYCMTIVGDDAIIAYASADTSMKGCEVLPVKLYNMRKCFFCPLFSVIFSAAEKMTYISFEKLAAAFATLIALGLAIWIAVQTLTHVSSLTKQDAPKFLAGLIKQSYKFLIAFLLLQYSSQIFTYAIRPILDAGIAFGGQFLEHNYASEKAQEDIKNEINERAEKIMVNAREFYICDKSCPPGKEKNYLYKKLDGYVSDIQREISFMQAVGSSLICTGNRAMFHTTEVEKFSDGFKMILQGLVFAGFGFLLSIAFAFYMVDAVVQLGIVGALMPFLIASWPFKITSQYAGTGFKMLLNSAFIFVFIGLTVEVNMQLINAALTNNVGGKPEIQTSNSDDVKMGSLQKIAIAINEQDSEELVELTDISTMGFLILIFCCIFGFKFMGQTSSLASQFSSGGIKPTAPSIATMGGSAALSGAKKLTKPVREAVGRKAEDLEMAVVGGIAHPIRTAKSIGRGITNVVNKFRGKKGGEGGGGTEAETEETTKTTGTTENSGKKKSPIVGQKGGKGGESGKTESTRPGNGPRVGQKPAEGGQASGTPGETPNEGGKPGDATEEAGGSAGTTESAGTEAPESGGESVRPKKNGKPRATSQNQRKYGGRQKRNTMNRNKQRRTYGRRHK